MVHFTNIKTFATDLHNVNLLNPSCVCPTNGTVPPVKPHRAVITAHNVPAGEEHGLLALVSADGAVQVGEVVLTV